MVYTSPFTCGRIIGLWEAGVPITEITKQFHTSRQAIQYKIDHYKQTGTGYPQYKKGRPRKLTTSDAKFAVLQLDRGRVQNAGELHREYFQFVHPNTLWNMLKRQGLMSAVRRKVTYLTPLDWRRRRVWAAGVKRWMAEQWKRVVFSDEAKFSMAGSEGRQYCWRRRGDAFQDRYTKKSWKSGEKSLMVWGCITEHGIGRLICIATTMRAPLYVQILQDGLLGTFHDYHMSPDHYFFQHDHNPKHTAHLTRTWIHDRHIHLLPWAPKSPDMNIIEHVWAYIDKRLEQRYPLPRSVDGLWEVIQEEWYKVPKSLITTLYESMPRRVAMLKMVKGGNTGY